MGTLRLALGLIAALCLSCSVDKALPQVLVLKAPCVPSVWHGAPIIGYSIEWMDKSGEMLTETIHGDSSIRISVPRGIGQYIVATPLIKGGGAVRPAGFLYPHDLGYDPNLKNRFFLRAGQLSYESGYVAMVGRAMSRLGKNPLVYPIEKLRSLYEDRRRDPWSLDPALVAGDIAAGAFRILSFPAQSIEVALPADCHWWPESPFISVFQEGSGQKALVSEGITYFFSEREGLIVKTAGAAIHLVRLSNVYLKAKEPFLGDGSCGYGEGED